MTTFTGAMNAYPHTRRLIQAPPTLPNGDRLEVVGGNPLPVPGASPSPLMRMLLHEEFDFAEVPFLSYIVGRMLRGPALVALPIFITRAFDHAKLVVNRRSGVEQPADLAGRTIGVRYNGFTDGAWARGVLGRQFGVDLQSIRWVTAYEETIRESKLPVNVDQRLGADLDALLVDDELDALVTTRVGSYPRAEGIEPLFADLAGVERAWHETTGVFPIHHVVVVKSETVRRHPSLVADLASLFMAEKRTALDELERGVALDEDGVARARFSGFPTGPFASSERPYLGPDPLPYGAAPNRDAVTLLLDLAIDLGVLTARPDVEELFVPEEILGGALQV